MDWLFRAIVLAALLHITEEYLGGFVGRASRLGLRITTTEFWVVNTLFVLLCAAAALSSNRALWLRMSVAGLIFVNAVLHLLGAIRLRGYSPGMISGVLLYFPLASYAFYLAVRTGLIMPGSWWTVLLLGVAWHLAVPAIHLLHLGRPLRT